MQTDLTLSLSRRPGWRRFAISLARRGYSVALIDKEEFPRENSAAIYQSKQLADARPAWRDPRPIMQSHEVVTAFRITAVSGAAAEAALPTLTARRFTALAQALFRSNSSAKGAAGRRDGPARRRVKRYIAWRMAGA